MRCATAVGWSESNRNSMPSGHAGFHGVRHLPDIPVEVPDDFAVAHFDGDHHGALRVERAVFTVAREHVHLVRNRRFVHAADFENVPQIHRRALPAHADDRAEHVVLGFVFAGELHREVASLRAQRAAGNHRVARGDRVADGFRCQSVAGEIRIRVQEIDRFRHDGNLGNFADAVHLLQFVLEIARQQFERLVTVPRRRRRADLRQRVFVAHQQDRRREIRVEQFTVAAGHQPREIRDEFLQVGPARRRFQVSQNERMPLRRPHLFGQAGRAKRRVEPAEEHFPVILIDGWRKEYRHGRVVRRGRSGAQLRELVAQQIRPRHALGIADRRTRDGEQHRNRVAEIGVQPRHARAFGQRHFQEFGAQLVPLLVNRGVGRGKLFDLQRGDAGARLGLDLLDGFQFADLSFERLGNKFLHFRSRRAREHRDEHRRALRNRRVFLLAEPGVRNAAPHEHADQRQPTHFPVLDAVLRETARLLFVLIWM